MILVIGLPILAIILVFFFLNRGEDKESTSPSNLGRLAVPAIAGFIVYLIANPLAGVLGDNWVVPSATSETYQISSVRSHQGQEAHAFLFSATIDDQTYYTYFVEENGGYRPNKISVDDNDVLVFEEDRPDGYLEVFNMTFDSWWKWVLAMPSESMAYRFHIPAGSIDHESVLP